MIGKTRYKRERDLESSRKNAPRSKVIMEIEMVKEAVVTGLSKLDAVSFTSPYPELHHGEEWRTDKLYLSLLAHLSYHLGQVNYLRRIIS